MAKKKDEKDVLVVRDEKTGEISVVAGLNADGTPKRTPAKAENAALYNAQMKISENNFIQGKIDIISLSLERARRSGAVTSYAEARVSLHNAIILLEMLTNVKY